MNRCALREPARAGTVLALVTALFLLSFVRPARCEVTLTLNLDRSEATLSDSVGLTVRVSGAHGDAARPTIQGLEDFHVRSAGSSTRVEIVNGRYSAGADFSYLLQPKKAGAFRIGPAELTLDGAKHQSGTATLSVGAPARSPDGDRGPVFLTASLAPARVYVEQQALYTLKLYRLVNISDASVNLPEVGGIAFSKLGDPREYEGVHQGRSYRVIEVRYLLNPQKPGTFTLPPARMDLTAYLQQNRTRRGIFDDPFFGQVSSGRPMTLSSEPLELLVLPLPRDGRPADFSGLVGSFTIASTLEPRTLKAGESATLTVTVRGRGNVKRIPDVKIPPLDSLKIYADQPVQREETDADGVSGSRTMKWALVPQQEGRYRIPPLAVSYFDTAEGRYRTLKTIETQIDVAPGSGDRSATVAAPPGTNGAGAGPAPPARREVAELGSDILPVHTAIGEAESGRSTLPEGWAFWMLLFGPPAAFMLTLGGARQLRRTDGLTAAREARKSAARFTQTCKQGVPTAAVLLPALQEYLNRRLSLSRGSLTAGEAAEILRSRKVDGDTVDALHGVWQSLEDAVYTGKGQEAAGAGEQLAGLIARIEKDLR